MVSTLFFDANNLLWIGTWSGVSTFDGTTFKRFPLPKPTVTTPLNPDTQNWITHITADRHNHIWIARDGYGATKYNGKDFSFFLKKNGLHSNHITDILEDRKGTLWFASRVAERDHPDPEKRSGAGGVTTFDGTNYGHFPEIESFNSGDVYELYEAPSGDLWISTVANGVYHYDGKSFIHMPVPIAIMSMVEDAKGTLWLGGSGGLYKRTPDGVISEVTTYGPWN